MITKKQVVELARANNINPYYQEKDYLLNIFLKRLYEIHEEMVFKGGTCLKLAYNYQRFSEDLDFNTTKPKEVKKAVEKTLKAYESLNIECEIAKEESFKDSYTSRLRFHGPLYAKRPDSVNTIQLDVGLRDPVILKPEWRQIASPYPDIPNYQVKAMQLNEIYAEKIRALLTRKTGRDLYDLWMLTPHAKPDKKLVNKKINLQKTKIKLPTEKQYNQDLQNLLPKPPPYKQIKKQVKQTIEKLR